MRTQFVRIYSEPKDAHPHSFYVGYMSGGISHRIASFDIDERTSFKDLRQVICWEERNGILRRTVHYSELLEAMKSSSNRYGYSKEDQRSFRFGVLSKIDKKINEADEAIADDADSCKEIKEEDEDFPMLIQKDVEDEPIDHIIEPGLDLILVPLVSIPKQLLQVTE